MKSKSRSNVKTPKIIEFPNVPTVYTTDLNGLDAPPANLKTTGIKVRGTGAATKGLLARGPMA
jgi:hypothetical protein